MTWDKFCLVILIEAIFFAITAIVVYVTEKASSRKYGRKDINDDSTWTNSTWKSKYERTGGEMMSTAYASIWVHTNADTGETVKYEALEWYGSIADLNVFNEFKEFDYDFGLKVEQEQYVMITIEWDEEDGYLQNIKICKRPGKDRN